MTTPAGWYDDGSGRQRWWDGQQWTEHFAPEVAAPEVAAPEAAAQADVPAQDDIPAEAAPEQHEAEAAVGEQMSTADEASSAAATPPVSDREDTVVAPEASRDWAAPAQSTEDQSPQAAYSAPGVAEQTTPVGNAGYPGAAPVPPPVPPLPQGGTPAYPGASAPAYTSAPGAYPSAPTGYGAPGAYAAGGYPAAAPYAAAAPSEPKKMSILGLVGLGLAGLGLILAFIPVTVVVAWILLAGGFIVSVISLFLKGKKWPGITGLGVSILGAIVAAIVTAVVVGLAFVNQVEDSIPDPLPTSSSDSGTEEDPDDGTAPTDVVEGGMGEPVIVEQLSGSGEVTINSATWSATNDSGFDPSNGGYLVVDLAWAGTEGTSYVNPLYFSVETAEGTAGDFDIFGDATLEAGEIKAGETSQGTVSFDVAQSASYEVIITNELMQEVARVTVEPSAG